MPKIEYKPIKFRPDTLAMVEIANTIIEEYQAQGFDLTLRQVYYQIVARDLFPDDRRWAWTGRKWVRDANGTKNAEPNYDWLGTVINNARLAGLIDWEAIVDRTRDLETLSHWGKPEQIIRAAEEGYRLDKWENQDFRPEVWVEKNALIGIVGGICNELDVPHFACVGYSSQSEMWRAGMRMLEHIRNDQSPFLIHLGDHDPSGIDMTRDIIDRLQMFIGEHIEVIRIALNYSQVQEYNPPPNPAKLTDSRVKAYIREYGNESWELDALEPAVIVDLIRTEIEGIIDWSRWDTTLEIENRDREDLAKIRANYTRVKSYLSTLNGTGH